MKLSKTETIHGVRMLRIRNFLRRYRDCSSMNYSDAEQELGVDFETARAIMRDLLTRGWLSAEPDDEWYAGPDIHVSDLGSQVAIAKFLSPLKRARAKELLDELLGRAATINQTPDLVFSVNKIAVFGSYLHEDKATLSDLDIAVDLSANEHPNKLSITEWSWERVEKSGKTINTVLDCLTYGRHEVHLLLKARNAYISIHELGEVLEKGWAHQVVFDRAKVGSPPRNRTERRCFKGTVGQPERGR